MHTHNSTNRALSTALFVRLALTIAALGLVKFLGIAIEAGPRQAPWGFLLIFVLPFAAGPLFLRRHRRTVTAITGLFSAVLATTCAVVIVRGHIEQSVMDCQRRLKTDPGASAEY